MDAPAGHAGRARRRAAHLAGAGRQHPARRPRRTEPGPAALPESAGRARRGAVQPRHRPRRPSPARPTRLRGRHRRTPPHRGPFRTALHPAAAGSVPPAAPGAARSLGDRGRSGRLRGGLGAGAAGLGHDGAGPAVGTRDGNLRQPGRPDARHLQRTGQPARALVPRRVAADGAAGAAGDRLGRGRGRPERLRAAGAPPGCCAGAGAAGAGRAAGHVRALDLG